MEPNLSPGIVEAHETLARFVAALHIDAATNTIKPSLFSHAGGAGMSVTRIELAGKADLARQQASQSYVGYVFAVCGAVRKISGEGRRAFCVYDTAQADNRAHADVCQSVFGAKSQASEMRRCLLRAFGRIPVSVVGGQVPTCSPGAYA